MQERDIGPFASARTACAPMRREGSNGPPLARPPPRTDDETAPFDPKKFNAKLETRWRSLALSELSTSDEELKVPGKPAPTGKALEDTSASQKESI